MSAGFTSGTGGGGEHLDAFRASQGSGAIGETEKTRLLQDFAASVGSVVQAAAEQGIDIDTPAVELPNEVFDRANEIYDATKPE